MTVLVHCVGGQESWGPPSITTGGSGCLVRQQSQRRCTPQPGVLSGKTDITVDTDQWPLTTHDLLSSGIERHRVNECWFNAMLAWRHLRPSSGRKRGRVSSDYLKVFHKGVYWAAAKKIQNAICLKQSCKFSKISKKSKDGHRSFSVPAGHGILESQWLLKNVWKS